MSQRKTYKRRKIFIDPVVQGAIVRQALAHWLVGMIVAGICVFMLQVLHGGVEKGLAFHVRALWSNYGLIVVAFFCLFPLFAYDSIRLSHRFTGPIYALRVALHKLADGQSIPEVSFRKDDFWTDLARDVNQIAQKLNQQGLEPGESGSTRNRAPEEVTANTNG